MVGQRHLVFNRHSLNAERLHLARLIDILRLLRYHVLLAIYLHQLRRVLSDRLRLQCGIRSSIEHVLRSFSLRLRHGRGTRWSGLKSDVGSTVRRSLVVIGRRLENDTLIVAFAQSLRLDAVLAHRSLFATFDAPFSTCQATSFCSFARQPCLQRGFRLAGIRAIGWLLLVIRRVLSICRCHRVVVANKMTSQSGYDNPSVAYSSRAVTGLRWQESRSNAPGNRSGKCAR